MVRLRTAKVSAAKASSPLSSETGSETGGASPRDVSDPEASQEASPTESQLRLFANRASLLEEASSADGDEAGSPANVHHDNNEGWDHRKASCG